MDRLTKHQRCTRISGSTKPSTVPQTRVVCSMQVAHPTVRYRLRMTSGTTAQTASASMAA